MGDPATTHDERDLVDEVVDAWRTELPEVAGLPLELVKRVTRLHVLLDEATDSALAEHGVTKAEYEILVRLRGVGPPYRLKPNELSRTLFLSTGGTTNALHRLTAKELTDRDPDPEDGRSSWVRLTPEGVTTAGTLVLAAYRAHAALLDDLPDRTRRDLAALLRKTLLTLDPAHRPPGQR